ncbi:MAG: DUF1080 domain-containing protein [Planctomycetaceae bacterium]
MSLEILNSSPRRATGCAGCDVLLLVIVAAAIIAPGSLLLSMTRARNSFDTEHVRQILPGDFKHRPPRALLSFPGAHTSNFNVSPEIADCCADAFLAAAEESTAESAGANVAESNNETDDAGIEARRPFDPPAGIEWTSLFNGKDLTGWSITNFGGQGPVEVVDGELRIGFGQSMTGVTIDKDSDIPKINYEVQMAAMRVDGRDFFCGLTFPVKDDPCSLILGGWGGGVCGLSSLDFLDASENETTSYREFKNGRWYHIRLRVQAGRIDAWIDGERIIKQRIVGRKIGIRPEVHLSVPFGLATYETTAAIKNLRIRPLAESEIEKD